MGQVSDWRKWLAEHGPALALLARQSVGNYADAQDLVQEAFVRFWRRKNDASDPAAYLYACMRRCCLEWNRASVRRQRREQLGARTEQEPQPGLFQQIADDERRKTIEAAMQSLPAEQREVVIMRLWGGLSFPQIAQATELSVDTVSSRYRYALQKLRSQLAQERVL